MLIAKDSSSSFPWIGQGFQAWQDVMFGNVNIADVKHLVIDQSCLDKANQDIQAYRDNGMPEEAERRLKLGQAMIPGKVMYVFGTLEDSMRGWFAA